MARSRETKIKLTAYDDLFQTDESRAEAKLSKIRDIPLSQIDEFPDHPFKILMDEDIPESYSLVIPLASRAFLIACPIGIKSKSKSLFLSSISSPPCANIILLLYCMDLWLLIKRCENADYEIFHFYIQDFKILFLQKLTYIKNRYN